jgi:hypothetical protein
MKFFGYTDKTPDVKDAYEEINLMTALRGVPGMVQLYGVFMDPAEVIIYVIFISYSIYIVII